MYCRRIDLAASSPLPQATTIFVMVLERVSCLEWRTGRMPELDGELYKDGVERYDTTKCMRSRDIALSPSFFASRHSAHFVKNSCGEFS